MIKSVFALSQRIAILKIIKKILMYLIRLHLLAVPFFEYLAVFVCLLFLFFCVFVFCFMSMVNSYGHVKTVSHPNHTIYCIGKIVNNRWHCQVMTLTFNTHIPS